MLRMLTALALLSSTAVPAKAAMMQHHDLASLAIMSDAIIKVRRLAPFGRSTRVRITEVYVGELRAGADMELPTSLYRVSGSFSPAIDPGETMIVFLTQREGSWRLTPSGLRVTDASGRVHRFVQLSNPGPYTAVPQGPDPEDVRRDHVSFPPVQLADFEPMLRRAIARADAMRAAIAGGSRSEILALLPAPIERRLPSPTSYFYNDALADLAARAMAQRNDTQGVLDVWSRVVGSRRSRSILRDRVPELLAVGADPSVPVPVRGEALRAVFEVNLPTEDQAQSVLRLLGDASPEVRAAALASLDQPGRVQVSDPEWPRTQRRIRRRIRDTVGSRWRGEHDAAVRVQMFQSLQIWRSWPRRIGRATFAAQVRRDELRYIWARRDNGPGVQIQVFSGDRVCSTDHQRVHAWHSGTAGGGGLVPTDCPRPWRVVVQSDGRRFAETTLP